MNNNDVINQIKDSLDIADIIGEKVKLRRTSRGFMGLCPFHSEDTPSFHVYTDTQTYYCFGCHASGNIFSYVMNSENLEFADALKLLADRAGIKLGKYHRESTDIHSVLDLAAKFFAGNLTADSGIAARSYMSRRKLDTSDIGRYSLGYSLNSWDSLTKFLRSKKIPDKAILDSGLALQNSRGLYDRFRGRLMFPIRDITGKVIAFGGRLIDGEGAKYINSPEGPIYSKRRNLYLLDTARNAIREKGRSILVEGYMDALRLHKCGFTEAVASLGTSLTEEQAKMLSRYSGVCYICYDADTAGQNAAVKGMYILAEHGLNVQVVEIPDGKDPDEFLCNNPPEKFEALLSSGKPLIVKHIEFLRPALDNDSTRRAALDELFEHLRKLNIDDVMNCMGSICDITRLPYDVVKRSLLTEHTKRAPAILPQPQKLTQTQPKQYDALDAEMCALLRRSQGCRLSFSADEAKSLLKTELAQETAAIILSENPEGLETLWLELGDTDKLGLISYGENLCGQFPVQDDAEIFSAVYVKLQLRSIEKHITALKSMPPDKRDMLMLKKLFEQRILYTRLDREKTYGVF